MAKNLGREFATMTEEERRRFEMTNEGATDAAPTELNLDNPRRDEGPAEEDEAEDESPPPDRPA
jgi:hypothetical protein